MASDGIARNGGAAPGPRVVSHYHELNEDELSCADDVVEAYRQATLGYDPESVLSREMLWNHVFENDWDVTKPLPPPTAAPTLPHKHVAAIVGWLNQDLPPSTCAVRRNKAKNKEAKKALGKGKAADKFVDEPIRVACHRKRGQPAFLRARLRATTNGIEWFWADGNSKGIDPVFVDLEDVDTHEKVDLTTAQAWALDVHDAAIRRHIRDYNLEKIIYWMRCRLLRNLGTTPGGQRPPMPIALDFASLERPNLLWPLAMELPALRDARETHPTHSWLRSDSCK
ncbi:phytanoyl- dioxygenase [Purpureocillium lavendulum]|uniref:Phytanoyl- dioxygenase n=1 Tax=Purpureocillium lavendulum TaxID=1247861 RepID=A0AB34FQB1_9HYPO|nr:phytanoyl- dioxygenase [Purpureocillium lavendulum]